MAESIKPAGEFPCVIADRVEARPAVPASRRRRIDIGAQHVVAGKIAVDALQVPARGTAGRAKRGYDGPVDRSSGAFLRAEQAAGGKVDGGIDRVAAGGVRLRILQNEAVRERRAGRVEAGIDDDILVRPQGQDMGAPCHRSVDGDVAVVATGRVVCGDRDIAGGKRRLECCRVVGVDGDVDRVDEPVATGGFHLSSLVDLHLRGGGFDLSRLQLARDLDLAVLHVAKQQDTSVARADGICFDGAGVVDDTLHGCRCALGRQDGHTLARLDDALVLDQRFHGRTLHLNGEQAVAIEVEQHVRSARKRGVAGDRASVGNGWRDQRDGAAGDIAFIDDRSACAGEIVVAGEELLVADAKG